MPDAIFADPRLARVYDAFDSPRDDLDAYVALVGELGARRVLDVGCGTGSLAVRLAEAGLDVVGVDPAEASLAVARPKPYADRVRWVHGDATGLAPLAVDLAVMTGNVAQVLVSDDAWRDTLVGVRRALAPGGHLVFETRRPDARAWVEWGGPEVGVRDVPGVGRVEQRQVLTSVALPLVSFRYDYSFADGTTVSSDSTLRFRSREELQQGLDRAGFDVLDVRQAPDRPGREYVFVSRVGRST